MPRQKDLKRLVRARMQKTGEAYTAARAQIVRKPTTVARATSSAAVAPIATTRDPDPKEYATLAGLSDAAIKEKTGCTWKRWVHALDHYGAAEMSHGEIAALIQEKYETDPWWSQTVTVGYERIRGLRTRGQRRDGTFTITRSRTYTVGVTTLFDAWADAAMRNRWLKDSDVKVRVATSPKSIRLTSADGRIIAVGFVAKGRGKSAVALEQAKLPDRETADRLKLYWSEKLDALGELLAKV